MKPRHCILFATYGFIKIWEFFLSKLGVKKDSLRVLLYHDINPIDYQKFKSSLLWLKSRWRFITPIEFEKHISGEQRLCGRCLLLTFDDGFKSNRIIAENILEDLGIKAIFFVVTDYIAQDDDHKSRNFYAKYIMPGIKNNDVNSNILNMNWDDLKWLIAHGHVIGAHTKRHQRLSDILVQSELADEIISSGDEIKAMLGIDVKHFAYTFGDINSFSFKALQCALSRYKYIYSGLRGSNSSNTNNLLIRRDAMEPSSRSLLLDIFLSGAADFIYIKSRYKMDRWSKSSIS